MVQRQRSLDQPGNPGSGLGMTDQGLHRTDHRAGRRSTGFTQQGGHGLQFGAITGNGAGAVRFPQPDRGR